MFQRLIDDIKDSAGHAVRLSSLAVVAGIGLFATISFLCAAAFIYVLQKYGLIEACLTGAAIFFFISIIALILYAVNSGPGHKHAKSPPMEKAAKSAMQSALADPMLLAAGLQVVRAVGIKRLIPILAIGGAALGFLASRGGKDDADDDETAED